MTRVTGGFLAGMVLAAAAGARATTSVVAAESVYGSVAAQLGGAGVHVTSILRSPTQDPHWFEAGPAAARAVEDARLVIANGAGYDPWMIALTAASPSPGRQIVVVADLVHAPAEANPHLWFSPAAMRVAVEVVTARLTAIAPAQRDEVAAGHARVLARLDAVDARASALRARFAGEMVAATEPVAGPLLDTLGLRVRDGRFQLAVMNGTEPRAGDVAAIEADLRGRRVRALVFNAQVTDPATQRLLGIARQAGVPVVGVSETLPEGMDYAGWMLAVMDALEHALVAAPAP